ncbi:restriction endonuclease BseRI [Streptomyces sp. XY58]|nr:restriction endonuclease BseRI [Streptomyces sp. XY58]KOV05015.1 restriction endonuclease BseRI [Streptomyces sp. XY37]KOV47160.1 restriction endonuclease BseRI [Streptomyces sp. MMG1064]
MRRIASAPDTGRSEVTVQADIRAFLLAGEMNLTADDVELEQQVGDGRRLDIAVGRTIIETKQRLTANVIKKATTGTEGQLLGYVATRTEQSGHTYTGILTDGREWRAYHLEGDKLTEASRIALDATRPSSESLLYWLEAILSTTQGVIPTPAEIQRKLGAESSAFALDRSIIAGLYERNRHLKTVQLKRELWAKLLRSALGTQFQDDDELFIEHTLLVNSAEIIAHLVLGLPVDDMEPSSILLGQRFERAHIYGVVEQDFFDWIIEVPEGETIIRTMVRRLARFDWSHVEHDVLKVLYQSVIPAATRKKLGEYYTPDWLAEAMVRDTIDDPTTQSVLDPSCGSGTFLFHAVRRFLAAADADGQDNRSAVTGVTNHVFGMDLHPVAVSLARVTYLLAIGRQRLTADRGPISVPVFLGDSLQWEQQGDIFSDGFLTIETDPAGGLFGNWIQFPDRMLADMGRFDALVRELASLAIRKRKKGSVPTLSGVIARHAVANDDVQFVRESFKTLCELVDDERNHIWSYYVRNAARPLWLSRPENRVDVLIGNPPWLSYRYMDRRTQERFKTMSIDRRIWAGAEFSTQQDLSGLFVARAIQLYAADSAKFSFVMPNSVIDREFCAGFRSGLWSSPDGATYVQFTKPWDLRRLRPHFFPRGAAVVSGKRVDFGKSRSMPAAGEVWSGSLPEGHHLGWDEVEPNVTRTEAPLAVMKDQDGHSSPYAPRFMNGATIYPRPLFFVDVQDSGPIGLGSNRTAVKSATSSTEKVPWKHLPRVEGVVEAEFVREVLLGESIVPFRVLSPRAAVLPLEHERLMDGEDAHLDRYPGLAEWWREVESLWQEHRTSDRLSLVQRLNYQKGLTKQLPIRPLRVVYGSSGMHVTAAYVESPSAIIDKKLYWAAVSSRAEAMYLCAILNSTVLTELARPLMGYGKDERDVEKHVWKLPIPLFDPSDEIHSRLAELGQVQSDFVAEVPLDANAYFVTSRRLVRDALAGRPEATEVNKLVQAMLASR